MSVSIAIPSTQHRLYASLFAIAKANKTTMATTSNSAGAFTTIQEKVIFEKEIKKSKFIAIAGPIPDEKSAMSFLSQVHFLHFFFFFFFFFFPFFFFFSFLLSHSFLIFPSFIIRSGIHVPPTIAGLTRYRKGLFFSLIKQLLVFLTLHYVLGASEYLVFFFIAFHLYEYFTQMVWYEW